MTYKEDSINRILTHIINISKGNCQITEDQILAEENPQLQEIMMGLLILHEDLEFGKQHLLQNHLAKEKKIQDRTNDLSSAVNEIKNSENKYSSFFESAGIGMIMDTGNGTFTSVNKVIYKMLSYDYHSAELVGKQFNDIIFPEDRKSHAKTYNQFIQNNMETMQTLKRYVSKDGLIKWGRTTISKITDANNRVVNFAILIEDQTEKKLIEEERDRLFNDTNDLVCASNLQGYLVSVNPSFSKVLGHTEQELKSVPWVSFIHPDDVKKTIDEGKKLLAGIDTYSFEHRCRCADNSYKWLAWSGTYDKLSNNIFGIARDITTQKENQRALKRSNEELQEFTYIATHDLKVPIANISGYFNIINDELEDKGELLNEVLPWIDKSIQQADHIIANLINVARSEDKASNELINWQEVVDEVRTTFRQKISQTKATLNFDLSQAGSLIYSKYQVNSIFQNLISNALKYHDPVRPPLIKVTAKKQAEFIRVTFEDNGLGIDLGAQKEKLFGLFKRIYTNDEEGSGMGLYMIKKLIEGKGGKIEVMSEVGKGTVFAVYLLKNAPEVN